MAPTRTPGNRKDDGRRAELIKAASRVVARDGIAAASTRRIADEAGVPSGLVHYWFAGKDELLQEVLAITLRAIEQAASAPVPAETGPGLYDRLRAAFRVIEQDDRGRQIALYEMTTWSLRRPELSHLAERQYAAYRGVAIEGVVSWAEATGARLPADAAVVGGLVAALFDGLVLSWLADPGDTDVEGVLRFACGLIEQLARPAGASPDTGSAD